MIAATVTFGVQRSAMRGILSRHLAPPRGGAAIPPGFAGLENSGSCVSFPLRRRGAWGDNMLIGVPLETAAGETRVAVTPETAKKLKAQGHSISVQSGAGVAASVTD